MILIYIMALQQREYPSIIKLKQLEKEMLTAINEYKYLSNTLQDYMNQQIQDGYDKYSLNEDVYDTIISDFGLSTAHSFHSIDIDQHHNKYGISESADQNTIEYYRNQMEKQIVALKGLVNKAAPILSEIIQKGELNQDIVTMKQKDLVALSDNLQIEAEKMKTLEKQLITADNENDILSKQQMSYMMQIIFISLLAIVVIALTVNAVVNPNSNSIETAILVIIVAVAAYFLYQKYV
jgi:hypothetical protein